MSSTVFQMTERDLLSAWRLQRRRNVVVWFGLAFPFLLLAGYAASVWRDVADMGLEILPYEDNTLFGVGVALVIANIVLTLVILPRNAKRVLKQQKGLAGDITATWDAEGMAMASARGHSRLAWGDYVRWLEDDAVLVLFQSDNVINPLPKRVLSAEQVAEIRGYLTAALGKAGKKRKLK